MKIVLMLLGLLGSAWWALGNVRELRAWEEDNVRARYYADGRLESESSYHGGLRHGPAEEWYPDGSPAARGSYEHGQRAGQWIFWREDGSRDDERSGLYVGGQRLAPDQESADS